MTFDLAAQLQLVQELRHLILVQAKRFLHGFTAELHTAEREEIERELFQRLRRRFQRCRIKRAGTGLIVTVRAFAESTAENQYILACCASSVVLGAAEASASVRCEDAASADTGIGSTIATEVGPMRSCGLTALCA
mgnify:CR=1 FL=1